MKKVVLVDGNNLLFRSYYATAYNGNFMKNSKGFPTNALYGFTNMINKIILEEKPEYILVAFDKGKTFRHDDYKDYKAGRIEMPNELRLQFPKAKELLDLMGIKHFEIDGFEADDIIGTLSMYINNSDDYKGLIVSSDRDLLQLITDKVIVKLLKPKDYIMMDNDTFKSIYNIDPIKIIDLKGLEGDTSDNIPGVKGIGEKTALKLLEEYGSIENIYANINNISGKTKEKLILDKDNAFMSKSLATIFKEVPVNMTLSDLIYTGNKKELKNMYEDLEFYSFLKNIDIKTDDKFDIKTSLKDLDLSKVSIYVDVDNDNYHFGNILGFSFYTDKVCGYIKKDDIKDNIKYLINSEIYTYDLKKNIVVFNRLGINFTNYKFDTMLASYLLNYNIKDDIAYLGNIFGYNIKFFDTYKKLNTDEIINESIKKSKFIYETYNEFIDKLNKECIDLYNNIEHPLAFVLARMEINGMKVDVDILNKMKSEIQEKLDILEKDIYNTCGINFNIKSPKQLGDVLFDKLGIPSNKKRSTDKEYLIKYIDNPVVKKVLEYKMLSKIYSTYIVSLESFIENGMIHTIYNQAKTNTGRLSSSYPNLQNIPTRYEYAKLVRKAFTPRYDYIVSSDYSQIELRVLASLSKVPKLIEAFNTGIDIHTKTAMEIFNVDKDNVTQNMRRSAKAVNFGIIYGISGFGLSENLDMSINDAKEFITKYFDAFPGVKEYMDNVVKDAKESGYTKTIMNRKRVIEELSNPNYIIRQAGERMAQNSGIQGSAADIIKKAMIDMDKAIIDNHLESKMVLQIHDELVFDVKESELEIMSKLIKDIMEGAYKLEVPLEVEISNGKDWYEVK